MNKKASNSSEYINNIFSFKWIILGVLLYSYGFFRKQNLYFYSIDTALLINQWDIIFSFFSNIYINIYVILPYLIFTSISIILSQYHYEKMIRLKSYKRWVYKTWIILVKDFSILYGIWLAICLILLIKVPFSKGWSIFSTSQFYFSETQVLQNFTSSPLLALFLTFCMVIICLSCLHLIFALLFILTQKTWVVVSIGVFIWMSFIVTFSLLPPNVYVFNLSNYLVFHAALSGFTHAFTPFLVLIVLLLIILSVVSRIDLKKSIFKRAEK